MSQKRDKVRHFTAVKANTARYILRNQNFVLGFLRSHPCVDCSEDDPVVLEFDHVDGSSKICTIAKMIHRAVSLEKLKEEVDKCVVRCANCHRRKTVFERGWFRSLQD